MSQKNAAGELAAIFLTMWHETADGVARLLTHSENHVFLVETGAGRFILRIHRPGYQTQEAIAAELEWLRAIDRDTELRVPRPVPCAAGGYVARAAGRSAVLFRYLEGAEPELAADNAGLFGILGRFAAIAHTHVQRWRRARELQRPAWNTAGLLDPGGLWGDWRIAPGVEGAVRKTLASIDARLRADLLRFGRAESRFGLIHADMRLANILVDGDAVSLIDFDDSGFGWFGYDFGAAVSFIDDPAHIASLKDAWVRGYRGVRPLDEEDIGMLDAFVLLRRMALVAWVGSHAETELARSQSPTIAERTAAMAGPYLR